MAKFPSNKVSRNHGAATLPAAKRAQASERRPGRMVRGLASLPVSVYDWLSGPPTTKLERTQASLAEARNTQKGGILIA